MITRLEQIQKSTAKSKPTLAKRSGLDGEVPRAIVNEGTGGYRNMIAQTTLWKSLKFWDSLKTYVKRVTSREIGQDVALLTPRLVMTIAIN
jgi:hypothetical protein